MEQALPTNPNSLSGMAATAAKADWTQFDPIGGLRGMAAVALPLGLGLVLHQTSAGAIMGGGALALGLGSFDRQSRKSLPVLLLAGFLMGASALAGTLTGAWGLGASLIAALWGFGGGLLIAAETDLWFIGLKAVVGLLIASGYAGDFEEALKRALLVFAGGLLQTLFLVLESYLGSRWREFQRPPNPTPAFQQNLEALRNSIHFRSPALRHALRLAVALILGGELSRFWFSHNAYWLPLTVVIILRPDFQQTFTRGLARMGGTLVGAGLTSLIVMLVRPGHGSLAVWALVFAWVCFSFFRVNYALYAIFITGYVVFMLSFAGLPEMGVVLARVEATCLGGILALLAYLIWPTPDRGWEQPHKI